MDYAKRKKKACADEKMQTQQTEYCVIPFEEALRLQL